MRKKRNYKRDHQPDMIHKSVAVTRFINYVMQDGKKHAAKEIVYDALETIHKTTKQNPVLVFDTAIKNAVPDLEVVSKRVGGANYQVPREVRPERKFFLAAHWLIEAARSKKGKPMATKLSEEILAAYKGEGAAIKKKQDMHRMAEANRAFAHFAR